MITLQVVRVGEAAKIIGVQTHENNLAPLRLKAASFVKYVVRVEDSLLTHRVVVKRSGDDLVVMEDGKEVIVIEGYFAVIDPEFVLEDDNGDTLLIVSGDETVEYAADGVLYDSASDANDAALFGFTLEGAALGALGVLGAGALAFGGGGGGSDDHDNGGSSAIGSTDNIAPSVPTLVVGDADADGKIDASGTAEPGSTVTVTWPDNSTSTVVVDGSGNWSLESPTVQEPGEVIAEATDAAGNTSDSVTVIYPDNVAPNAPTLVVADADADGKIDASGTAEPGSTVTVTWPDNSTSTVVTDGSGNWSLESPTV
ncbi:Ig-like domain-containing protein, partial [Pseudomonas sp. NPDC090755]|uniref:Ig-like domain-containing protein n=1 Tax=Pseudomonas sp. NPDC090755 TaxID=3364481 RepID=UPI00383B8A43